MIQRPRKSRNSPALPHFASLMPLLVFIVFCVVLFFTGGSARSDQAGVMALRPLAVLVAGGSLLFMSRDSFRSVKGPLLLLAALAALVALQLVPLPPALWSAIPSHKEYAATFRELNVDLPWLPITHFPVRTWNALTSLAVPLAALVAYANLPRGQRDAVIAVFIGFGILSALLGIVQVLSGGDRSLYLYSIANFKSNCGLFANRNHQAIFQAGLLLLVPFARKRFNREHVQPYLLNMVAMGTIGLLIFSIFTTGSRLGFALGVLAGIWSSWQILKLIDESKKGAARFARDRFQVSARAQKAMVPLLIVAIGLAALLAPRSLVLDRLVSDDAEAPIEDMRVNILQNSIQMIEDNIVFGGGAGTFADVYAGYEQADGISYRYVNHAHDDLLEIIYEFGIPGIILVLIALVLLVKWASMARRSGKGSWQEAGPMLGILLIVFVGSLFDYPARTPIGAVFVIILLARIYAAGHPPEGRATAPTGR